MVAVFVALCQGIVDAGFHEAIIQKKELDDSLISTVFFTNLLLSFLLAGGLWVGAPLVSDFYDQPLLTALLRVLCLGLLIDGLARIQLTLLQREMLFRKLATATLVASVLSGIVAVALALSGAGVWALVWQILLQRLFVAIMFWMQSPWRPQWLYSIKSLKEVLPFSLRMFASNFLNTIFQQIYVLVIGRVGSPVDLGYYQRADSFKRLASNTSNTLMSRVTFPLFAQVQDDLARLRRGFIKASQLLGFLFFPFMAVLAAVAEPLIVTLIGEKWLPAVPYLQLLCIIGALHPVHAINLSLLKALGQARLFLRLELVKKSVIVMVLLVTFRHGAYMIVVGQLFSSLLALCINGFFTHRLIKISYFQQLKMYVGSVILSIFVACAVSELLLLYVAAAPLRLISALVLASVLWPLGVWLLRGIFTVELDWFFGELARLPWIKKKAV